MGYMAAGKGIMYMAGAPVAGTDAVQTITFGGTPAGGSTFILNLMGYTTAPIAWSSTPATLVGNIQTAADGIGLGAAQIVASGTPTGGLGVVTLTYSGANVSKRVVPLVSVVSAPSGGTLVAAQTTAGVDMNPPYPPKSALVMNTVTGILLSNSGGTPTAPVWAAVGAQV